MTATPRTPLYKVTKPNFIYAGIIALLLFVIGTHFFVTNYLYPAIDYTSFAIDVPARGGGDTYYTDPEEFRVVTYVATAIFGAAALLVLILLARGKKEGAAFTLSFFITTSIMYTAVILGNAFYELWRGWWPAAGIAIAIVIGVSLQIFVVKSFKKVSPNDPINP